MNSGAFRGVVWLVVIAVTLVFGQLSFASAAEGAGGPQVVPDEADGRTILVHTVGPDGKPMPGVKIHVGIWTKEPVKYKRDYVSDSEGRATVKLPRTFYILRLWADTEGHVPLFAHWEQDWIDAGQEVPEEFTFNDKVTGHYRNSVYSSTCYFILTLKTISKEF